MLEEDHSAPVIQAPAGGSAVRNILIAVAVVYIAISAYFIFEMRGRLDKLETAQAAAAQDAAAHNAAIIKKLGMTESSIEQARQELASRLGATQKEVVSRTEQLKKQQAMAEQQLQESQKQIGAVASEVGGVKTDVAGAKTDIASTRTDLEATKSKLERAIGDLGVQSGLIAHTKDELEFLKHRGDRNYYDFTLTKGAKPKPVSTVSLQLRKVDPKKGKYTLNVLADDRTIEKKDRNFNEPVQFYTGRDRNLYELVVFSADKHTVTGYISTPKSAPQPAVQN